MQDSLWWNQSIEKVFSNLESSESGLTASETKKRLKKYSFNEVSTKQNFRIFILLFNQFKNWLIIILLAASVASFFLGQSIDSLIIVALVLLSVFFGFLQEYKAEKTLSDLRKYITNRTRVLRDGKWLEIDSKFLVPGDIVEVHIGDKIPADLRLIDSDSLLINESVLTGESMPVSKSPKVLSLDTSAPSKLSNMLFMGTNVEQGMGKGVVVSTGENTFFGRTSKSLEKIEPQTDFQKQIKRFSLFLFRVIVGMTAFIFISNVVLDKGIFESFLFATALAVGIAPEMLPAIITVTLSQGAMKMAKNKVIVKRLISVEDLGNVDTLCIDKTGTLTQGNFSLADFKDLDGQKNENLLLDAMVCTSGITEKSQTISTNPLDRAIWESPYALQNRTKLSRYSFLDENEFDYKRKRMSVLVKQEGKTFLIAKGAHESILSVSNLDKSLKKKINKEVKHYENSGYRVIAVAEKPLSKRTSSLEDEKGLTLKGFLLFKDPIKPGVRETIQKFMDLKIELKIISGDSLLITTNIAREAGINFKDDEVITGESLENLKEDKLLEVCRKAKIFTRVTPEQKHIIVKSLNYEGHIVGFLGDGVNDAPALKAADVGIAVDTGAEIAKDASDIILLEKDLNVLSEGIVGGRKTFGNIMKYILNTISANYGNMSTVAISSLFLNFIPLLPTQILLNNFVSDVPLFAVATDNVDPNLLRKPKKWNIDFIGKFMVYYGFVSTFFDLFLIIPMITFLKVDQHVFRTAWFVESSISEMLVTFAIRTSKPFYKSRPSSWLLGLSILSIAFVIFMPLLKWNIFGFVGLPSSIWVLIVIDLLLYFVTTEFVKKFFFSKFGM